MDKTILIADNYKKADGRNAFNSNINKLSLGYKENSETMKRDITANIWESYGENNSNIKSELEFHQLLDLSILALEGLLHFREAYRFPKLYDPDNVTIDKVAVQGVNIPVSICMENENIDEDIVKFNQILSDNDELIGERIRIISRLLKEMGY